MTPSRQCLETQVRRFYDELWNQWRFDLADELLAPELEFRGSLGTEVRGREGFLEYARGVRGAFPDFHNDVRELVADERRRAAAARLRYSGRHEGALLGVAPTGRRISYAGAAFFRFDDRARVVRGWVLGDLADLFVQLGIRDLSLSKTGSAGDMMASIGPRPSPLLAVALNGSRDHPRAPRTARELAEAARASVDAGARVVHLHPYDGQGRETLAAEPCAEALRAVRAAVPGVPVSLSTSAEIEPDPRRRLELVGGWTVLPELVTANQGEPGIAELCEHLIGRGVGIEAGLLSVAEAGDFERSPRNRSNGGATTMGAAGSLSAVYPGEVATRARAQRTRPLGRRGRPASRAGGAEFTVTG